MSDSTIQLHEPAQKFSALEHEVFTTSFMTRLHDPNVQIAHDVKREVARIAPQSKLPVEHLEKAVDAAAFACAAVEAVRIFHPGFAEPEPTDLEAALSSAVAQQILGQNKQDG